MLIFGIIACVSLVPLSIANAVSWKDIDAGRHGSYPTLSFRTSNAKAPYVNFVQQTPACNDGLQYFVTPKGWKIKDPGPMILDANGTLIWSHHFQNEFGGQAYNLRVQRYKGEDYLTFWLGDDRVKGHGAGHYYMLNSSYDIIHKIGAADNKLADLHEFTITPQGTALIMIFQSVEMDVRPGGRKFNDIWNQAAWDCLIQEVDIETGTLVFEWRASTHLNMSWSYEQIETPDMGTREKPYDWIHLNAVDKDDLGNYLVSARNLHALIYIDGKSGEIIWILGGKGNQFRDLSGGQVLNMAWQHDAKFVSSDEFPETYQQPRQTSGVRTKLITVFDNAALSWDYRYGFSYSRVLLLELSFPTVASKLQSSDAETLSDGDLAKGLSKLDYNKVNSINGKDPSYSVRLVQEFINPQHVRSSTQGSAQIVPQGKGKDSHVFVGYGINAVLTDYYGNGTVACDLHYGAKISWESGDVQSYRAYKAKWTGKPRDPPSISVARSQAFVSWNGATEVSQWLLQAATVDELWEDVVLVPKDGFETAIPLRTAEYDVSERHVRVRAIDSTGLICENGRSDPAAPFRLTSAIRSRLDPHSISLVDLAIAFFGSGALVLLLLRRRMSRHKNLLKTHRSD